MEPRPLSRLANVPLQLRPRQRYAIVIALIVFVAAFLVALVLGFPLALATLAALAAMAVLGPLLYLEHAWMNRDALDEKEDLEAAAEER